MFSVKVLYRKVVANLFILLVLKFHNHRTSSLGVMIFSSPVSESVQILYRFRKWPCLPKLNWESVLSNYRRIVLLCLIFPTNFGSPFWWSRSQVMAVWNVMSESVQIWTAMFVCINWLRYTLNHLEMIINEL